MERVERRELPGNDASWYRALLGDHHDAPSPATQAAPPPEQGTETRSQSVLTAGVEPVVFPPEDEEAPAEEAEDDSAAAADDDAPQLVKAVADPIEAAAPKDVASAADKDTALDNTSEMVGQLWTASDTAGPLENWQPDEIDRKVTSSRPFRWTSLLALLGIIALIAVGLVLLPSITRNRASDHRELFASALSELRGELPDTQTSLAVATDPSSDAQALAGLSTQLTVLAAKTSDLDSAAQADLPATLPLTSSEPIDELEPIRQRLEPLSTVANTIQRRISNLIEYRSLLAGFLFLPDLPISADSATQSELRVTLAAAQADSASILAELPTDVALESHHSLARGLNERFATWQVDYLEALRTEDSAAARDLLAELGDGLAELENQLVAPLAEIRSETDRDLIELASSIDEVAALTNGDDPPP